MELLLLGGAAGIGYLLSNRSSTDQVLSGEEPIEFTDAGIAPQALAPQGPYNPLLNVSSEYSENPMVPDALPEVINYQHDFPDTDRRVAHNYPGPPIEDMGPMTPLQAAFQVRGYGDTGRDFGPADVTNSVDQQQGLMPWFGRAVLNPLTIDPLDSTSFKPPKTAVSQSDLHAAPERGWNVHGNPDYSEWMASEIDWQTKTRSAAGQYDYYWPGQLQAERDAAMEGQPGSSACLGDATKDYGFAGGEKMTARTGGFHYGRQRFWREPRSDRKQIYFSIRNPSTAVGRFESEWSQGTGPLGSLKIPYNARVKEYYREPQPTAGLTANRIRADEKVILPFSNRTGVLGGQGSEDGNHGVYGPTEVAWAGPMGPVEYGQEAFRITDEQRDVTPNKTTQFPMGFGFPGGVTEAKGPQTVNPTVLRPTHRSCYEGNRGILNDPYPYLGTVGGPSVYNTEMWLNGPNNLKQIGTAIKVNQDGSGCGGWPGNDSKTVDGGTPNGPCFVDGVMRPGGPSLPLNSTGDRWATDRVNPTILRPTQKDETIYDCAVWQPMSNRTLAPQLGLIPAPENRMVTPQITQEIDASLVQAFLNNPYTSALPMDN